MLAKDPIILPKNIALDPFGGTSNNNYCAVKSLFKGCPESEGHDKSWDTVGQDQSAGTALDWVIATRILKCGLLEANWKFPKATPFPHSRRLLVSTRLQPRPEASQSHAGDASESGTMIRSSLAVVHNRRAVCKRPLIPLPAESANRRSVKLSSFS
jgi:hypothetical protein